MRSAPDLIEGRDAGSFYSEHESAGEMFAAGGQNGETPAADAIASSYSGATFAFYRPTANDFHCT